jgi:hypothetical protein
MLKNMSCSPFDSKRAQTIAQGVAHREIKGVKQRVLAYEYLVVAAFFILLNAKRVAHFEAKMLEDARQC